MMTVPRGRHHASPPGARRVTPHSASSRSVQRSGPRRATDRLSAAFDRSAAIVPGQRFCGQCGAQLAAQPLAATDYVNPRFASERLPGVNPARACESCGRTGTVAEGKCTACGFDHLTRKGPHSGRG